MNTLLRAAGLALFSASPLAAQSYTWTTIAGLAPQSGATDGAGTDARFNTPYAVAVYGTGNVYVADRNNHTIRKITAAGVVSTLAGGAGESGRSDGFGSAARFNLPAGVAVDAAGSVYVADSGNHTIRKITPEGVVSTFAGAAGALGIADGTGASARFNTPWGLALDGDGNLFVSDRANRTIRKVTSAGVVSTLAGLALVAGSTDGVGSNARFSFLGGIALDGAGNLIIADASNNTIRKLTPAGVVSTVAGTAGVSGSTNATGTAAQFNGPFGVEVDPTGNIYVADVSNDAIRRITPDGVVTTFAGSRGSTGSADGTTTAARFFRPYGICRDAAGNFYVADAFNHAVRKITSAGVVSTLAGLAGSQGSFGAANGTGSAARFNAPRGVAVDSTGHVYVADSDNNAVRRVTPEGVVSTFAGLAGTTGFNDGTGSTARFNGPWGIAVDSNDRLYVSDNGNFVIRTITPGGAVTTLAGLARTTGSADGTGSAARFAAPRGVAVDREGNAYVADSVNNTIRKVSAGGVVTTLAGSPGNAGSTDGVGSAARFASPYGIAVDSAGYVYVCEFTNSTVRKIAPDGTVTTLAGLAGSTGATDANGANARFNGPMGLAVDPGGNVYVADMNNHTIRKITPAGAVTTIGGQSSQFGSRDGTGQNAYFIWPTDIEIDSGGVLYVVDSGANVLVKGVADTTPVIVVQPMALTVTPGTRVTFGVTATGGGLNYQWILNGTLIGGATANTYTLASAQIANSGTYSVTVSNSAGSLASSAAPLNVITTNNPGRLVNLSILTPLAGGETMTIGTAIGGSNTSGNKALVARAAGPSLAAFGISSFLPDPKMAVIALATGSTLASNNDWQGDSALATAFAQVGAFPYSSPTSKDAGLSLPTLAPGNYTVQVSDNGTGAGSVIAELYDATSSSAYTPATPRLINVSVLKQIAPASVLTAGFVIGGSTARTVLVRAVGPSLSQAPFNLLGVLGDPKLELFNNSTNQRINENNDWGGGAALTGAFSSVGAFPLASPTTKDAVLLMTLPPGQYSARVSGADSGGGTVIVEVYEVP